MDSQEPLVALLSSNHRRVLSIRVRLLEEACLGILDLFHSSDSALISRSALDPEKAASILPLVEKLRSRISEIKSELGLRPARVEAERSAAALAAAMTVGIEELLPRYLRGYGAVPVPLEQYLEALVPQLLTISTEIERVLRPDTSKSVQED